MTANERCSGLDVPERGDSKHLHLEAVANKAARQLTSFSG